MQGVDRVDRQFADHAQVDEFLNVLELNDLWNSVNQRNAIILGLVLAHSAQVRLSLDVLDEVLDEDFFLCLLEIAVPKHLTRAFETQEGRMLRVNEPLNFLQVLYEHVTEHIVDSFNSAHRFYCCNQVFKSNTVDALTLAELFNTVFLHPCVLWVIWDRREH